MNKNRGRERDLRVVSEDFVMTRASNIKINRKINKIIYDRENGDLSTVLTQH